MGVPPTAGCGRYCWRGPAKCEVPDSGTSGIRVCQWHLALQDGSTQPMDPNDVVGWGSEWADELAKTRKILVVSTEAVGHVTPLVPLVGALLDGGDQVLVTAGPGAAPRIEKTGAEFAVAGPGQSEYLVRLAARTRGIPGDGVAQERILQYFLPRAFGEIGVDEMVEDVLRHGQKFAPDLVLFEAFALAGPLRPTSSAYRAMRTCSDRCRRVMRSNWPMMPSPRSGVPSVVKCLDGPGCTDG